MPEPMNIYVSGVNMRPENSYSLAEFIFTFLKHMKIWDVFDSIYNFVTCWKVGWLCWGLTSQSTIFQSYRDGAIASWVINQYFRGVKCLAQGHNTAAVGLEPRTSRSGVRHSTTEPPRSPCWKVYYHHAYTTGTYICSHVCSFDWDRGIKEKSLREGLKIFGCPSDQWK